MFILYSTPTCSRCHQVQQRLTASGKVYQVANMESGKILAELRLENIFSLEAPILRKQAPSKDEWYLASDLFRGDMLDEDKLAGIIGGESCSSH